MKEYYFLVRMSFYAENVDEAKNRLIELMEEEADYGLLDSDIIFEKVVEKNTQW